MKKEGRDEALVVEDILDMGVESLDPENFKRLETALKQICKNRCLNKEIIFLIFNREK